MKGDKAHRCRITARYRVPGGTYFFTLNLLERRADLLVQHIEPLREAVKYTRADRPFHIAAWVVLPDHMHCVITLPPGDGDFSNRIKAMKIRFVQALPPTEGRSLIRMAKGESQGQGLVPAPAEAGWGQGGPAWRAEQLSWKSSIFGCSLCPKGIRLEHDI